MVHQTARGLCSIERQKHLFVLLHYNEYNFTAPYTYSSFPYKPSKASGDLHTRKLSVGCTSLHVSCHFDVPTFTWDCTLLTGLQFGPGAIGLWLFTFLYRGAQVVNVLKKAWRGDQTFSYLLSLSRNKWLSARALPSSCINTLFSLSKKVACIAVWR